MWAKEKARQERKITLQVNSVHGWMYEWFIRFIPVVLFSSHVFILRSIRRWSFFHVDTCCNSSLSASASFILRFRVCDSSLSLFLFAPSLTHCPQSAICLLSKLCQWTGCEGLTYDKHRAAKSEFMQLSPGSLCVWIHSV